MILSKNCIQYGNIRKSITASFGVGFYPHDGYTIEAVIKTADQYFYKAKDAGKNKVVNSHKYMYVD